MGNIITPKSTEPIVKNGISTLRLSRFFEAIRRQFTQIGDITTGVFALTDSPNISTDCAEGSVFTVTLGGNRTLDNPTNKVIGATYTWIVTQDGTGSRTLAFGTDFDFLGSSTIRPGANTITVIEGLVVSDTSILCEIKNAPGRVIQTVQEHVIVTSQQSLMAGVRANITNLNKAITPTSTSSKILIRISWSGEVAQVHNCVFGIKRNSTNIGNPAAAGNRNVGIKIGLLSYYADDTDSTPEGTYYEYLDSPATESSTTYYATILGPTTTLFNNRTATDNDSSGFERLTSTITLMEISG